VRHFKLLFLLSGLLLFCWCFSVLFTVAWERVGGSWDTRKISWCNCDNSHMLPLLRSNTVLLRTHFLGINLCNRGARSTILCPMSYRSDQKSVVAHLPISVCLATENKSFRLLRTWIAREAQGCSGSVLANQSHRILSAQVRSRKLEIPSPPSLRGRHTLPHATWQCTPFTFCDLAKENLDVCHHSFKSPSW
jgi:hypothetical protein